MASHLSLSWPRLLTVEEFLQIDFGPDVKAEYREIGSVRTIAFVDPDAETLSVSQRIDGGWTDTLFAAADLSLPDLGIVVPHAEIFAED